MKARWLARWRDFWAGRSAREQRALQGLAAVLVLALVIQGLSGLAQSRQRHLLQLPRLQAQLAQLQAWQADWQQTEQRRAGRAQPGEALWRAEMQRRLAELGAGIRAEWQGDGRLHLTGRVSFTVWLRWLGSVQQEGQLVLERGRLLPAGGEVEVEAWLRRETGNP